MFIRVNENDIRLKKGIRLLELKDSVEPNADVIIFNGFQTQDNIELQNGDNVVFICKGKTPEKESFQAMMMARHTPGVYEKLKNASVGVAGVGGLGSNVALALARSGVGRLVLADFDLVEPSNLNRQAYLVEHLGKEKTEAIKDLINRTNPYVEVETHNTRITSENVKEVFDKVDVLIEAFDQPNSKAELVNTALLTMKKTYIVAGSGMAGYFSSNTIETKQKMRKLYVVGDECNEAKPGSGLMAPRVNIAAGHQANMALRILLGDLEP